MKNEMFQLQTATVAASADFPLATKGGI